LLEQQDGQRAARLAAMIYRWLWLQGQVTESRQLIERVLELDPPMDVYRARVLAMAGDFARMQGDLATARRYADDGVAAARASGDPHAIGAAVGSLGNVLVSEGDGDGALVAWAEAAALATEGGDISAAAAIRHNIGEVAYDAGRYTEAAEQAAAAVKGFRQAGLDDGRAIASALLAAAEVKLGDRDGARRHIDEALALVAGRGFDTVALPLLELTAILDATDGHYHRSARLLGHADSRRERIGLPRTDDTVPVAELRATLIAHLGAEAERCLQEGAALSSDAAVELARSGLGNVTE
jgi:tetratricopeptide (TPR) repeat protein